jgi:hypothetical protein
MAQGEPQYRHRLGPLVAGSSSSELRVLANQEETGLRLLENEDQARDYYRTRCAALNAVANEFFYNYQDSSSLILQKTRETHLLPDFVEYVYCWFARDQLCGAILSGVTSDAGTHAQVNDQESVFCEHSAEVAQALSSRYSEAPDPVVNYFNFEAYPVLPQIHGLATEELLRSYQRLITSSLDGAPTTRIETHYCGPAILVPSRKRNDSDFPAASTHSSQASTQTYASKDTLVVYDFKVERYVRTIESIHVFENLVYLSRILADQIGRPLNTERCALERTQAQAEIDQWKDALRRADEAKKTRILRLAELL